MHFSNQLIPNTCFTYLHLNTTPIIYYNQRIQSNEYVCINSRTIIPPVSKTCGPLGSNIVGYPQLKEGYHSFHIEIYKINDHLPISSSIEEYYIKHLNDTEVILSPCYLLNHTYGILSTRILDIQFMYDLTSTNIQSIQFDVKGLFTTSLSFLTTTLSNHDIEPGSWFFQLSSLYKIPTQSNESQLIYGIPAVGYIEFVLNRTEIRQHRVFSNEWKYNLNHDTTHGNDNSHSKSNNNHDNNYCYTNHTNTKKPDIYPSLSSFQKQHKDRREPRKMKNICIWGSNKLDGQKMIWLQQIQHLSTLSSPSSSFSSHNTHSSTSSSSSSSSSSLSRYKYQFKYIMISDFDASTHNMFDKLNKLNQYIHMIYTPQFHRLISVTELMEVPNDGSLSFHNTRLMNESVSIYEYMTIRWNKANHTISQLSPSWIHSLFQYTANLMMTHTCHLNIYGNDRELGPFSIIRHISMNLHIPIVAELLNLFPSAEAMPHYLIAPSLYAATHTSVIHAIHIYMSTSNMSQIGSSNSDSNVNHENYYKVDHLKPWKYTEVVIIPPAVDSHLYNYTDIYTKYKNKFLKRIHPSCALINQHYFQQNNRTNNANNSTSPHYRHTYHRCFHIGFMGRLAPEKNPGLFIQMAAELLLHYSPHIRFTIIGDGPIKSELIDLTKRLHIEYAVTFLGWIPHHLLPNILIDIDILINTSLRGWSETFCIANIEAMSMRVPLVTFGVGGVGEYVDNTTHPLFIHEDGHYPFTATRNAMLVHDSSPSSLASAVSYLMQHDQLRENMSDNGMRTIQLYFTIERQMQQYRTFYDHVLSTWSKD